MILKETVEKVKALDIVAIIGDYLQLKRAGANWKGLSPWSGEKTPSLMVSPAKNIFKDFSSGKGGGPIAFIMEKEYLEYPDAIRFLCKKYSIECLETQMTTEEMQHQQHKEALYIINAVAQLFYRTNLTYLPEAYLYATVQRGLDDNIIEKFQIGFGPNNFAALTNKLINEGYNWQLAVESSVLGYLPEKNKLYDRFRNRLMFPIRNITGNVVGFGGRALAVGEKIPKYINSTDSAVYNKSEVLYGIFESKRAIVEKNHCFVAEGYLDVVTWHRVGRENIVATGGTALTIEQVKLIKRFTKNVTIMFDPDTAGRSATMRGIDLFLSEEMNVKVLPLPEKVDPDDFAKLNTPEYIDAYIAANSKDFVMYKLRYLLDLAGDDLSMRSSAITDVVGSISKIPNAIQREVYLKECARITEMNVDSLRQMMKTLIDEQVDFTEVSFENFQNTANYSRMLMREQCERKILQYVLAYGFEELSFKEVFLGKDEFRGEVVVEEEIVVNRRTVLDKVKFELENDGLQFSNVLFSSILEKAKSVDLRQFHLLREHLTVEAFGLAEQLRDEELAMNKTSFTETNISGNEIVRQELHDALEKSINETLLFYKTIHIEEMIEEQSRAEVIDMELIAGLTELMVKIKRELNFV